MVEIDEIRKEALIRAIEEAKKASKERNFEQSVEVIITTEGLDLKKPENRVRAIIHLPEETGKPKRICVFADGMAADQAKEAGADFIITSTDMDALAGNRKKVKEISREYDFFLAYPQMMRRVGQVFGFALGPRGKTPEVITPTMDLAAKMKELRNSISIYLRQQPVAACTIGSERMDSKSLAENALAVITTIYNRVREKARIGHIYVKMTMGRPVRVV